MTLQKALIAPYFYRNLHMKTYEQKYQIHELKGVCILQF